MSSAGSSGHSRVANASSNLSASRISEETRCNLRASHAVSEFSGKIECLTYYSSRIVVGTNDGRLIMFDTRKGSTADACETSSYQFPHKRPITQIIAVPHIRMVVVIADTEISVHGATDLQNLSFDLNAANSHKVKICCINQRGPPHFRLGVALLRKRAIMIYQYYNSDKCYKFLREIPSPDVPEAIAWYRNKVVIGLRKEYLILNDRSGEPASLSASNTQQAQLYPLVKLLPKEEILISCMDKSGVFMTFNGEQTSKAAITWSQAPSCIEYSTPYIISLIPRSGLQIHSIKDQSLLQFIPIDKIHCIFANGLKWDMEPRPQGDSEDIIIVGARDSGSNTSSILRIEPMPADQHVSELLDLGKVDQALKVLKKSINKLSSEKQRSKMKRFHRQAGIALLRRLEFEVGMEQLYRSGIDPCELLAFYPEYQCPSFKHEIVYLKADVLPRDENTSSSMSSVIREIQSSNRKLLSNDVAHEEPRELLKRSTKALLKFMEMYKKHKKEKLTRSNAHSKAESGKIDTEEDLRRIEAVDTALLHLYVVHGKQKELGQLLQESTAEECYLDLHSCKTFLVREKCYYEAALLYIAHGKYEEAINMFVRLHSGEYKQSKLPKPALEAAIDVFLAIPNEKSEIIYRESIWFLKECPKQSLRIFTDRTTLLNANEVVAHIKRHAADSNIAQKYLETLVKNEEVGSVPVSNAIGTSRATASHDTYAKYSGNASRMEGAKKADVDSHHTRLALEYLEEVQKLIEAGEQPSKSAPGKEGGALGDARKRLLRFLKSSSSNYDVEALIPKVKSSNLFTEFIILCGRGQLHEQALRSLIYELNDLKGAENYAVKYGQKRSAPTETEYNNALLTLVNFCFHAEEDSKKAALNDLGFQILARHTKNMNGEAVLDLLPKSTTVSKLVDFFGHLLPSTGHQVREKTLVKHLSNVYNLQVQCERVSKRAEFVQIDSKTTCCVCQKRIGDIVFAVYPNGKIVHYNCSNGKLDVCPVTGESFSDK